MKGMRLKFLNIQPETFFIIIALIYGSAFVLLTPPLYVVPDETSHFFKAIGLSEGELIPEKVGDAAGVYVPDDFYQTAIIIYYDKLTGQGIISKVNINANNVVTDFVDLSKFAIVTYSPVPYVISALVIKIGAILSISPFLIIYLTRFFNFLIWVFLVFLAIKIIPIHKWVLLMLVLMPMTMLEATAITADSLVIALAFLLIAYILRLALNKNNLTKKDFIILLVLGVLISLTKSIYILLFLLFLLIPVDNFVNNKNKYGIFSLLIIPISLLSLFWGLLTNNLYRSYLTNWSLMSQITFIEHNPLHFLIIILTTFINHFMFYLGYFVGLTFIPSIISLTYFLILILVALLDKNELKINLNHKLISLITIIIFVFSIMTYEYLTWNPTGNAYVNGIQGRYFIPIAPLFLLLFYNKLGNISIFKRNFTFKINKFIKLIIICTIIVTLSYTLSVIVIKYY